MEGTKRSLVHIFFILLLLVSSFMIAAIGCTSPAEEEEEEEEEITEWALPNITIMTGPAAAFGLDAAWGVQRAVDEINDAGGILGTPIEITKFDSAYDPAKSVLAMSQALDMDPLVIIGPMDDLGLASAGHLAVEQGVPFVSSILADTVEEFAPWGTGLYPDPEGITKDGTREWLTYNPDIESIVILYLPESPSHVAQITYMEPVLADMGVEIVEKIECTLGQIDFAPQATRALASGADGYYSLLNVIEHVTFCKALYERGMTEGWRICASGGATGGDLFTMGEGFLEDTYHWDCYDWTSTYEPWLDIVDAYEAEHPGVFPYSTAMLGHYEAVYALKAALETLEITGDPTKRTEERIKIRDFLFNATDIPGVQGNSWSNVEGIKTGPTYLFQIKNNEFTLVSQITE